MKERKIRTIYRTAVGVNYIIKNLETDEEIVGSTLNNRDKDRKPWRTPKGTPVGEEFFWMKIGSKKEGFTYIKFMNSSLFNRCLSDDKKWEFVGKRPNGEVLERLDKKEISKKNITRRNPPNKQIRKRSVEISKKNKDQKRVSASDIGAPFFNEEALQNLLD